MTEMVYGIHSVQALLKCDSSRCKIVYVLKGRTDKRLLPIIQKLKTLGIMIQKVNRKWMNKKTENGVHQGIIAKTQITQTYQESDLAIIINKKTSVFLLILDNITDPHNLGACLRSAEAAGVDAVIVPKDKSAQLNATAKKVACGAAESISLIRVTNLARTIRQLQQNNIWIVGTTDNSNHTLYESKLTGDIALIIGAEGVGMRRLTKEYCNELISIPMTGIVTSLNASVAAGVCLFEAVRQRLKH